MKAGLALPLICALANPAAPQNRSFRHPRFQDYPVTEVFRGEPLGPEHPGGLVNLKKETNFAGHYMVVQWLPGGDHIIFDIFDTKTGQVFEPPVFPKRFLGKDCANCLPTNAFLSGYGGGDLRVDSRLMIMDHVCPTDRFQHLLQYLFLGCHRYYFVWENDSFKLLR